MLWIQTVKCCLTFCLKINNPLSFTTQETWKRCTQVKFHLCGTRPKKKRERGEICNDAYRSRTCANCSSCKHFCHRAHCHLPTVMRLVRRMLLRDINVQCALSVMWQPLGRIYCIVCWWKTAVDCTGLLELPSDSHHENCLLVLYAGS